MISLVKSVIIKKQLRKSAVNAFKKLPANKVKDKL